MERVRVEFLKGPDRHGEVLKRTSLGAPLVRFDDGEERYVPADTAFPEGDSPAPEVEPHQPVVKKVRRTRKSPT